MSCAGKQRAELQHSEAEAAHERALAFAREESDQALALVCADLATLQNVATSCTAALASALAGVGSGDLDDWTADWSLDPVPSQGVSDAEQETVQARMSTGIEKSEARGSDKAARELKHSVETAEGHSKRMSLYAAALKDERSDLECRMKTALDDCHKAEQRVQLLTEQLADSAAQRAEQAERLQQDLEQQRCSLQLELEDSRRIASALETSQVQLQARLSMLQQEGASLQDAHRALEQVHAELQGQMRVAHVDAQSLHAELEAGATAKQALQDELAQAGASFDAERLLRAQAQEELAAARQAGADLERQLDAASKGAAKVQNLSQLLGCCRLGTSCPSLPRPGSHRRVCAARLNARHSWGVARIRSC